MDEYLLAPLAASTPFAPHSTSAPPKFNSVSLSGFSGAQLYSDSLHPVLSNRASNNVQSHRQQIVKEIFDTEHTYISQLNTVITLFLKPVRVGGLIPADVVMAVFSNIEAILSVNNELFHFMRQKSLGEAFTYLGPFLKLYSTYANNFQNANSVLQDWLRSNSEFSKFVSLQEARPECCGLRLSSQLITPVQRIPRYKLLLKDLLKHTRRTHPDYSKLSKAADQIESVASHINEFIRQHENFNKMLVIQNSLTGPTVPGILAPARRFFHEGRLMKICYRKAKERMVFLFSDILIYAKPKLIRSKDQLKRYECRCVLPLFNSSVELVHSDQRAPGISALLKVSNVDTSVLFYSEKEEEVLDWVRRINDAIVSLQSAFGRLMTSESEFPQIEVGNSPALTNSAATQHLGTLTPRTPYPLTATLFSTYMDSLPPCKDKEDDEHSGNDATLTDSSRSEREKMIPLEGLLERTQDSNQCCTIS